MWARGPGQGSLLGLEARQGPTGPPPQSHLFSVRLTSGTEFRQDQRLMADCGSWLRLTKCGSRCRRHRSLEGPVPLQACSGH